MATIRCPQCGTEIEEGTTEFCPNPNCGFPLSFGKQAPTEEVPKAMERKPLEKVAPTPAPAPAPPPPPAPVPPPAVTPPKPARSDKRPNVGLLIGGALLAVVAIVAVVLVVGGGDKKEEPKPAPKASAALLDFARVPGDETVFGGEGDQIINRVVAGDDELIAVGYSGVPGSYDAAVWTSTDGETWSRVTADPEVFGGDGEQEMLGIAKGPDGFVIVGRDNSSGSDDAAVWVSDGVVFDRVDPTQAAFGGTGKQVMTRVIQGPPGFLAVGTDDSTATGNPDAGLWKSVDGTRWARDDSQSALTGEDDQFMRSIVSFGDGYVGVGRELHEGDYDAAVWKSSTGTVFDRILGTEETFGGPGQQQMYTVTTGGPGLVAVGEAGSGGNIDAEVWVSKDGETWERLQDPSFGGEKIQLMLGVTNADGVLIATGYDKSQSDPSSPDDPGLDGAIWQSSDGRHWTRLENDSFGGPGEQQIKNAVAYRGKVIAVGWDGSGGDLDAAVWSAPLGD